MTSRLQHSAPPPSDFSQTRPESLKSNASSHINLAPPTKADAYSGGGGITVLVAGGSLLSQLDSPTGSPLLVFYQPHMMPNPTNPHAEEADVTLQQSPDDLAVITKTHTFPTLDRHAHSAHSAHTEHEHTVEWNAPPNFVKQSTLNVVGVLVEKVGDVDRGFASSRSIEDDGLLLGICSRF